MNLIQESFHRLFPNKDFLYQTELQYNRRLGDFNANITIHKEKITIKFNLQWKDIDNEIKIGLIQSLILKILRKKATTPNIQLYNNFIKQIPVLTPKTKTDVILEASFKRINEMFFSGSMEQPNLQWGKNSFRRLAHYNFHDDTVTMSTIFQDARTEVIDSIMYHEILHKHFKFQQKNGRSSFHSKAFRDAEKKFPNYDLIEREITHIIRNKKKEKMPKSWWQF